MGYAQGFLQRVNAGFHIVANESHLTGADGFVDGMLVL